MKKKNDYTVTALLIPFFIAVLFNLPACYKIDHTGHECRWDHCPYKGITTTQYHQAIVNYTGCDKGADCYNIDVLHLQYPAEDYDQLEERLLLK